MIHVLSGSSSADARVFFLPYAGGNARSYAVLAPAMPRDVEALALELPGRGARFDEAPLTRMADAIDDLTRLVLPYLDRPFVLFGHSLGGRLAFELAHHLDAQHGVVPRHMILSATDPSAAAPRALPANANEASVVAFLSSLGGTPPELLANEELMALIAPTIAADLTLALDTVSLGSLPCGASLFSGRDDVLAPPTHVRRWRARFDGDVDESVLPGGHFYFLDEPHAARRALEDALSAAFAA